MEMLCQVLGTWTLCQPVTDNNRLVARIDDTNCLEHQFTWLGDKNWFFCLFQRFENVVLLSEDARCSQVLEEMRQEI